MGDGEYGPQPPNSEQAEQSVLGAMLLSKSAIAEVVDKIAGKDFYRPNHQLIFDTIVSMWTAGEPVDPVTVSHALDEIGQLSRVGAPYLLTLYQTCPTAANVGYYSNIIVEKSKLRKVIEAGTRLVQFGYAGEAGTDVDEIVSRAERELRGLAEPSKDGLWFAGMLDDFRTADQFQPIPTPWGSINKVLNGGLRRGKVCAIGGRPGFGKSAFALNIAANSAEHKYRTAVISMEMPHREVTRRILAAGAGVQFSRLITGRLDLDDVRLIAEYEDSHRDMPLYVNDRPEQTVEQIVADCRANGPFDLIIVDYLQMVRGTDLRVSKRDQVNHISRALKIAARELDAAIVAPVQLNRGPVDARTGKMRAPVETDIGEADGISRDSDVVLLLHQDENDPDFTNVIFAKHRDGARPNIPLRFDKHIQRVTQKAT